MKILSFVLVGVFLYSNLIFADEPVIVLPPRKQTHKCDMKIDGNRNKCKDNDKIESLYIKANEKSQVSQYKLEELRSAILNGLNSENYREQNIVCLYQVYENFTKRIGSYVGSILYNDKACVHPDTCMKDSKNPEVRYAVRQRDLDIDFSRALKKIGETPKSVTVKCEKVSLKVQGSQKLKKISQEIKNNLKKSSQEFANCLSKEDEFITGQVKIALVSKFAPGGGYQVRYDSRGNISNVIFPAAVIAASTAAAVPKLNSDPNNGKSDGVAAHGGASTKPSGGNGGIATSSSAEPGGLDLGAASYSGFKTSKLDELKQGSVPSIQLKSPGATPAIITIPGEAESKTLTSNRTVASQTMANTAPQVGSSNKSTVEFQPAKVPAPVKNEEEKKVIPVLSEAQQKAQKEKEKQEAIKAAANTSKVEQVAKTTIQDLKENPKLSKVISTLDETKINLLKLSIDNIKNDTATIDEVRTQLIKNLKINKDQADIILNDVLAQLGKPVLKK